MLKKYCWLLLLLLPLTGKAQLKSAIDTLHWNNEVIRYQRSTPAQMDSFRTLSRIAFQVGGYLIKLEGFLNEAKSALKENRDIYEYTLNAAASEIKKINDFYSRFDTKIFEQELEAYRRYNDAFDALEQATPDN